MPTSFSCKQPLLATPQSLWSLWTDVENWPHWDKELLSAQLNGPFCQGTAGNLTPVKGPSLKFKLTSVSTMEGYTFVTYLPLCQLKITRRFIRVNEEMFFCHTVNFQGLLGIPFGWLLGRQFQAVLPQTMQNLQALALRSSALNTSTK